MFMKDKNIFIIQLAFSLDVSGNPVTQQVQSVAVTDASGNPITGIKGSLQEIPRFNCWKNTTGRPNTANLKPSA